MTFFFTFKYRATASRFDPHTVRYGIFRQTCRGVMFGRESEPDGTDVG